MSCKRAKPPTKQTNSCKYLSQNAAGGASAQVFPFLFVIFCCSRTIEKAAATATTSLRPYEVLGPTIQLNDITISQKNILSRLGGTRIVA